MTTYSEILATLSGQLDTVEGLPTRSPTNMPFKPTLGKPYVRDTFMPVEAASGAIGVNGFQVPQGLYQVDVFYPVNIATSASNALAIADAIVEAFGRKNLITTSGSIVTIVKSFQAAALQHPEFYQVPVRIKFAAYGG